jgi:hypothetical protein
VVPEVEKRKKFRWSWSSQMQNQTAQQQRNDIQGIVMLEIQRG